MNELFLGMLLTGVPILALVGIGCLLYCKGKNRRYLAWTAAVFLTALVLFFGGSILLGCFGLTWRSAPAGILCGVLLVSGWAGIVLTLACALPMEWPNVPQLLRWAAKGVLVLFAAVVLVVTLWAGPLALLFGFYREERVVEYQNQTLLEVDDGFLDSHYSYYAYCGPLVRGAERLWESPYPIDGGPG